MSEIADKIYAATGLTLGAEAAAKIGQMIQVENEKLREALQTARRDGMEEAAQGVTDRRAVAKEMIRALVEARLLQAENEKLRAALRAIAEDCEADYPPSHGAIKYAARAALGEKE